MASFLSLTAIELILNTVEVKMKNIILLHGSWHAGWCWYKIAPRLEAQGFAVHVPDLPAHGRNTRIFPGFVQLSHMVQTVTDILDSLSEKAIIVVHSRSGIVASQAAELRPDKVEKIVYLASFMLKNGERAADWFFGDKDSLLHGQVDINKMKLTDMIKSHIYKDALYADCPTEDVSLAYALLTPEPSLPALTRLKLTNKNYGTIPRYYIELTQDRAVSLNLQRRLIQRSGVEKVYSLESSHSAYFSKPNELVKIILEII